MNTFNNNFYTANKNYTKQDAEARLISSGINNYTFTGMSYSNGVSFYFESETGHKIRVSDHILTGKRAFYYIQIDIVEIKKFSPNKNK
jgi:hypothetical protein